MWFTDIKQTAKGHETSGRQDWDSIWNVWCEAQTVIASTDIENKKGNQGNSVFLRTEDRVLPKTVKPKIHLIICDIIVIGKGHYSTYTQANELLHLIH